MVQQAVLDACVLVPVTLCDVLLELAEASLFEPLWSAPILAETKRALTEKRGIAEDRAEYRIEAMRVAFPHAMLTGFDNLIPQMRNHPKDRHVLASAVHAKCRVIVTANLADFPEAVLAPYGVKAVHPDDFLLALLDEDATATWEAVDRKRSAYRRPPQTMAEFCGILGKTVPRFAAKLLVVQK